MKDKIHVMRSHHSMHIIIKCNGKRASRSMEYTLLVVWWEFRMAFNSRIRWMTLFILDIQVQCKDYIKIDERDTCYEKLSFFA